MEKNSEKLQLEKLGNRLKTLRRNSNLTVKYIAEKYGIPPRSIANWESGSTEIGILNLVKYLEVFAEHGIKVSIDALLDMNNSIKIFI